MEDAQLLREFAENGSRDAMGELVRRHLDLVYGACLRQLNDSHLAEDATQAVFIILAKKAAGLRRGTVLAGWLINAAHYAATNAKRGEQRRRYHERKAAQVIQQRRESEPAWEEIAPMLDEGLASLGARDRDALVLRYLQGKSHREVGAAMGIGEAAAERRVARAVMRLRKFFHSKGLMSGGGLAVALAALPGVAAPQALHASALSAATGGAVGASAAIAKGAMTMLFWTKMKVAGVVVAMLVLAGGAVGTYIAVAASPRTSNVPIAQVGGFEPTIELVVRGRGRMQVLDQPDAFLCLGTDELLAKPAEVNAKDDMAVYRWMKDRGVDIIGDRTQAADGRGSGGLAGIDMVAVPTAAADWDGLEASALRNDEALASGKPVVVTFLTPTCQDRRGEGFDKLPATWIIKTRSGRLGILQIVQVIDRAPSGVKVRYKLVDPRTGRRLPPDRRPEAAKLPARMFNSPMKLDVWLTGDISLGKQLGSTPAARPLAIPAGVDWGITSAGNPPDMPALARELDQQQVPGLRLAHATNGNLATLEPLKGLRILDLTNTQVTDAGLVHLRELKNLETLVLMGTHVTDAGLLQLTELKGLRTLDLGFGTRVTDAGLATLRELNGLQELYLEYTQVTDAALVNLKDLKSLRALHLSNTNVTDEGLVQLKELKSLQTLALIGTKVTDVGLAELKELKGLRLLDLQSTKVTDAGIAELRKSLPQCEIRR